MSTTDLGPSQSCVNVQGAAPWFYGNCTINMPTVAVWYPLSAPQPAIGTAALGVGLDGYDQTTACGGNAVSGPQAGFNDETLHEYFLR
jgi:hypothetical protein